MNQMCYISKPRGHEPKDNCRDDIVPEGKRGKWSTHQAMRVSEKLKLRCPLWVVFDSGLMTYIKPLFCGMRQGTCQNGKLFDILNHFKAKKEKAGQN